MEWAARPELVVLILVLQVVIVIIDIALNHLTMQTKLIQNDFIRLCIDFGICIESSQT